VRTVTLSELRRNASGILDRVEKGERISILRHGRLIANLVPPGYGEFQPAWRRPGLRLVAAGASLSKALLEERRSEH
jgi:prevent-host-death family protein